MGWSSRTTIHVGAVDDAAEYFRLKRREFDDDNEPETLPEPMDNSAVVRPFAASCRHFSSSNGDCPYGRGCHFKHHSYVLQERERERACKAAEDKMTTVATRFSMQYDISDLLWDSVQRLVPLCPSQLHDDCEGTDWIYVASPAAHAALFQERASGALSEYPKDIIDRITWCLEEASCGPGTDCPVQGDFRSASLNVPALLAQLRAGGVEELQESLQEATQALEAERSALVSPHCTCQTQRRPQADARRGEVGEEDEEYLGSDDEAAHEPHCPWYEEDEDERHSYGYGGSDDDVLGYYGGYTGGRNVRQRSVAYDDRRAREVRIQQLEYVLGRLEEADRLNSFELVDKCGEPSNMSLEQVRAAAEEALEWRRQGDGSGLPPLDLTGCTTRAEYVAAMEWAHELTDYEKMRLAFSLAAESGQALVIEHDVN
jgi:hypothetical protein